MYDKNLLLLVILLLVSCTPVDKRQENAEKHAEALGLKNPIVNCDASISACGCTISWEIDYGRQVQSFNCCKDGCE